MDVSFEKTHSAYMLFYEHFSMDEEQQPERKVRLAKEMQDWIWEDNVQFLRDKLVFDISYFNFMWQFCHSIPKTIDSTPPVDYFSIKLAASFMLETLVHSREKPHMKSWMELLLSGLEKCQPACEWILDTMGSDDWWLQQMFIKCPGQPLRQVSLDSNLPILVTKGKRAILSQLKLCRDGRVVRSLNTCSQG